MPCGHMSDARHKKNDPEDRTQGEFWRTTILDADSRLRVACGIGPDETQASLEAFQILLRRGHSDKPPWLLSDGWGGIDDAMLLVYGKVPSYSGRGRPPSRPKPQANWHYLQMVKVRDERGHFKGIKLRPIYGEKDELVAVLGQSTAYLERSNLTARLFSARLTRKTLAFSKRLDMHRASAIWEDAYYNLVRPHKSLRLPVEDQPGRKWKPQTPAVSACLTDHIWTVKELLMLLPLPCVSNT